MGGAHGHISHIWEETDLTFSDLMQIAKNLLDGTLQDVQEKIDGSNLVVTYDQSRKILLCARTGLDIKKGGMNAAALAKKFAGRGSIENSFNEAFLALKIAVESLPVVATTAIFGSHGEKWRSMEIVDVNNPNTILYNERCIVLHDSPAQSIVNGTVVALNDRLATSVIISSIDQMRAAAHRIGWNVYGPAYVSLQKTTVDLLTLDVLSALASCCEHGSAATIDDYLVSMFKRFVDKFEQPDRVTHMLAQRCAEIKRMPSITMILSNVSDDTGALKQSITDFVKNKAPELRKLFLKPIVDVFTCIGVSVIEKLHSTISVDCSACKRHIFELVANTLTIIEQSGNDELKARSNEMLDVVTNYRPQTIEGIVFQSNDRIMKATGVFAQTHQLISLTRYIK